MKHVTALAILLLIPTVAFAKGECRDDIKKFCKDVRDDKGKLVACMDQHQAELSDACKARREAKVKQKNSEDSATMGKDDGTHTEPDHGSPLENDTSKIDQPERRNVPSNTPQP